MQTIERTSLDLLFQVLIKKGYRLMGPTIQDHAIVYDSITSAADLPEGWTDEQDGGKYRLKKRKDNSLFGFNVGPQSWKKFLHLPKRKLWEAEKTEKGFNVITEPDDPPKLAFIGIRSCELHAIGIQDKVFIEGPHQDCSYLSRRNHIFTIAVNCGQAGGTCFCVSMKTGPKASEGFDLSLTEILDEGRHYFIVEVGSDQGREIIQEIPNQQTTETEKQRAETLLSDTARQMGRHLDTQNIKELIYQSYHHPRWDEVAGRCLTCANCTMVCPTCFCTTVEDLTDLKGKHTERWQKWDSCFTMDFSYIHGGTVRSSAKSRYRQWLSHKLATWIDQFGTSGCVGCGRCITWCPVGIDITEEVRGLRG